MTNFGPIAGVSTDNSNANGNIQLFAGESDIVTTQVQLVTGVAYVGGQVLGRVTATGLFAKHDPAATNGSQIATHILGYDVPVPTANKWEGAYSGGVFNVDALTFNAATDTVQKKIAVFDGTNILAQRLLGNPAPNSGPV
jgi:hypothetical protein